MASDFDMKRLLGPMLAGLAIDAVDLATFGPIGVYYGLLLGGAVGWFLAPSLGFPARKRWVSALLTGVYCTMPFTSVLPLATAAATIARATRKGEGAGHESSDPALRREGAIDVEFESRSEDRDRG